MSEFMAQAVNETKSFASRFESGFAKPKFQDSTASLCDDSILIVLRRVRRLSHSAEQQPNSAQRYCFHHPQPAWHPCATRTKAILFPSSAANFEPVCTIDLTRKGKGEFPSEVSSQRHDMGCNYIMIALLPQQHGKRYHSSNLPSPLQRLHPASTLLLHFKSLKVIRLEPLT